MLVLKHVGKNVLVQERLCQKKGGPTIIEAEKIGTKSILSFLFIQLLHAKYCKCCNETFPSTQSSDKRQ